MSEIKHARMEHLEARHKKKHEDYEYYRKDFVPRGYAGETNMEDDRDYYEGE